MLSGPAFLRGLILFRVLSTEDTVGGGEAGGWVGRAENFPAGVGAQSEHDDNDPPWTERRSKYCPSRQTLTCSACLSGRH